ncbi:hypothetical protein CPter291_0337 [Collimonas pratensis]|uniref:Uncharacterized protein n=1 Tax=Collimonas pratensis TaxID=279113 RepID=A0ABM5Z0S8_9BURK|nr:hypothetical protein CPter291_0337 [Collimonas pratensis]
MQRGDAAGDQIHAIPVLAKCEVEQALCSLISPSLSGLPIRLRVTKDTTNMKMDINPMQHVIGFLK